MKILQVIPAFYPAHGYGGGPRVVYEISKRLVKKGHEVIVYTTDADDKHSRFTTLFRCIDGIEVYYFKNISNSLAFEHKIFLSPGMVSMLAKSLKNFDIIHIHDTRTIQSIITYYFAKMYGIPYVLQPHGTLTSQTNTKKGAKRNFDLFFGNKILRNAIRAILLNKTEAEKCLEMGLNEAQNKIIPNGIDLSTYRDLPEKGTFKEKYRIDINQPIILYLGRIHESKGIDLLVRAFAELFVRLDHVKLVIVGPDDGYLSALKDLVILLNLNDKVLFTGAISENDKIAAYLDSDVFVTPSFYGFPLTFLEAMACGVPIITTKKGDFIEGIDNEIGYVVEYNDLELENALFKILSDDELRERFKRNAKEKINEFDWNSIVDRIEQVYKEGTEKSS